MVSPLDNVVAKACATTAAVEREPSERVSTVEDEAVKKPSTAARVVEVDELELAEFEEISELAKFEEAAELAELEVLDVTRLMVVKEV